MKILSGRIKSRHGSEVPGLGEFTPQSHSLASMCTLWYPGPPQACPHKMHTIPTETPINTIFKCLFRFSHFILCGWVCLHASLHTPCMPGACRGHKVTLELELPMVVSQIQALCKTRGLNLPREAFLGAIRVGYRNSLQITAVHEVQPEHSHVLCCSYTPL